jgi:biopolymer transport protein ExbB
MDLVGLFMSSFRTGGPVMWPILAVSLVVWFTGFGRLQMLRHVIKARKRFWGALRSGETRSGTGDEAYDTLLRMLCLERTRIDTEYALLQFRTALLPRLDEGFPTMNTWISAAPLLGLLGTVVGMVHTFRVITDFGIDNPHLMAEGIRIALLTTQAGLAVAFPALLFHNHLLNRKNRLVAAIRTDEERLRSAVVEEREKCSPGRTPATGGPGEGGTRSEAADDHV